MSSHIPIVIDREEQEPGSANTALLQATEVPEEIQSRLPPETSPISTLLETNVPNRLLDTAIIQPIQLCSSPLPPYWTVEELFKTSLPPRTWLYTLEQNLSALWAAGTRSIKPPLPSRSSVRFPLWVVNFWNTAVEVTEERDQWLAAVDWLSRRVQGPEIHEARNLLKRVPWGIRLWSLTGHDRVTRIGYLAELLSNQWLGERHIDTISSYLTSRMPGLGPTTLIANTDLHIYLLNSTATTKVIRAHGGFQVYTKRITDHPYSRLFIPANVGTNHWVVFSVDFEKRVFQYGESG